MEDKKIFEQAILAMEERYGSGCEEEIDAYFRGVKWLQEQYTIEEQHIGHTIDELDKEYIKGFNEGSNYYIERMYSEEDVKNAFLDGWQLRDGDLPFPKAKKKWFNEFKKE